jgi:hypothetical protein
MMSCHWVVSIHLPWLTNLYASITLQWLVLYVPQAQAHIRHNPNCVHYIINFTKLTNGVH